MPSDSVLIRPLAANDIHTISQLHSSILPLPYPSSYFRQCILHPHIRPCMVAHPASSPQTLIAFVSVSVALSADRSCDLHILSLGVVPTYRRRGLARRLVEAVIATVRQDIKCGGHCGQQTPLDIKLIAHTPVSNTQAHQFYQDSLGLQPDIDVVGNLYKTLAPSAKDAYRFVGYVHLAADSGKDRLSLLARCLPLAAHTDSP